MGHYSLDEWKDYADNRLPEEERNYMEEHILSCDKCLELYLNALEKETSKNEIIMASDFTDVVMNKAYKEHKQSKRSIPNFFMYYVAAACITIFFMSHGVFDLYGSKVVEITNEFTKPVSTVEQVFMNGWTDRILDKNANVDTTKK